jgi:hypothetical protein
MKNTYSNKLVTSSLLALALASGTAFAGTEEMMKKESPVTPAPSESVVSGILKLDFNSHFISYGADVWGDDDSLSDYAFNPLLELSFALPAGFTGTLGTWWDVNSKGDSSTSVANIGGQLREVDVWAGLSYTADKFTVGVTFQDWLYGSATEEILDVKLAYDCFLSPSITFHNRLGAGASGGNEGTIAVLGLSHSVNAGPLKISFPLNVAWSFQDDYHANSTDSGYGYTSDSIGEWTLYGGLTQFFTDNEVIGNFDDDFLTSNIGLSLSF